MIEATRSIETRDVFGQRAEIAGLAPDRQAAVPPIPMRLAMATMAVMRGAQRGPLFDLPHPQPSR